MISFGDIWQCVTGAARHKAEAANERAYQDLEQTICARGIDGLDDINRLMRGDGMRGNDHGEPAA